MLVRGGASAVGTAAIQLAVAAGARVIAVAGGPEKTDVCRRLGAELAIDHTTDDLFDAVMDHTDGRGADVAFDVVGGADGREPVGTVVLEPEVEPLAGPEPGRGAGQPDGPAARQPA